MLENVQKDHENEAIPFEIVSNESLRLSDFQSRSNRKATKINKLTNNYQTTLTTEVLEQVDEAIIKTNYVQILKEGKSLF